MSGLGRKKDYDYFAGFHACAIHALDASIYLHEALTAFDVDGLDDKVTAMHKIENDADMKKHDMLKRLAHEFMTPIEREDIVALSQALDNVVDAVEDVLTRVYMFCVKEIRPETHAFTSLIVKCCRALVTAVEEFKHFKKSSTIKPLLIEVNAIESDGDKLYAECMRKLFFENSDSRVLLIWSTMFDCLENCLDACEDAADIIESVIMKNT